MVNNLDIYQIEMDKIKKDMMEGIKGYQNYIDFCVSNVPIQALCLPKNIENILLKNDLTRVYQLTTADLTKIKGFGEQKVRIVTDSLAKFVSI